MGPFSVHPFPTNCSSHPSQSTHSVNQYHLQLLVRGFVLRSQRSGGHFQGLGNYTGCLRAREDREEWLP